MTHCIKLHNIKVRARHGVYGYEKITEQHFIIDLTCTLKTETSFTTDDLRDTVDWQELKKFVIQHIKFTHCNLIETLCANLAKECLVNFPLLKTITITISKPEIWSDGSFPSVTITLS